MADTPLQRRCVAQDPGAAASVRTPSLKPHMDATAEVDSLRSLQGAMCWGAGTTVNPQKRSGPDKFLMRLAFARLYLRGKKKESETFVTPTETNVHGDALCFLVMAPSLLQSLAVDGWWRLAVGGWRLVVPGAVFKGWP